MGNTRVSSTGNATKTPSRIVERNRQTSKIHSSLEGYHPQEDHQYLNTNNVHQPSTMKIIRESSQNDQNGGLALMG